MERIGEFLVGGVYAVGGEQSRQDAIGDNSCESSFLMSQQKTVVRTAEKSDKCKVISPCKGFRRSKYGWGSVWRWLCAPAPFWRLADEQQASTTHPTISSTEYARACSGHSSMGSILHSPWILRGLYISILLAISWACIPQLLCYIVDFLVEFEPSPLRKFTVACIKDQAGGQLDGTLLQDMDETQKRGGLDIMGSPKSGDKNSCQALMHLYRDWGLRPHFGTLVFFLKIAMLCSLDVLRFGGLGPLLPEPVIVQRRLQRLGPILSALFLMIRPSHEPVQPPCEEWVFARAMPNTKGMLHADISASAGDEGVQPSPFDFVVVGGGAAGSTLAGLLSSLERPRNAGDEFDKLKERIQSGRRKARILVLEAGGWPDLRSFSPLKIPARTYESQRGSMDWGLTTTRQTQACKGLHGGMSFWPRGKGLGGSSWLNYMLYVRGDPRDFDSFSNCARDKRWQFRRVLRILKQIESVQFPADPAYRGTRGPITVNIQRTVDPTVLAFLRSAEGLRLQSEGDHASGEHTGGDFYSANPDYNAERYSGPSLFQLNTRRGRRRSPLEAFLFSSKIDDGQDTGLEGTPTVSVIFRVRAIKILFESAETASNLCRQRPGLRTCPEPTQRRDTSQHGDRRGSQPLRATGVLVVNDQACTPEKWGNEMCEVFEVPVNGELILSAGAIHTPQILLQSGVGDATMLQKLGLPVRVDLPGVGRNLQDHIFTPRLFLLKDMVPLDEFADGFPASTNGSTTATHAERQNSVQRLDAYASLLHSGVSWDAIKEIQGSATTGSLAGGRKGGTPAIQLSIKTVNEHRGNQLETIWKYLTQDTGLLASSGVEAQVVSEYFKDLRDEEDLGTPTPSSCPHGSAAPDIQLHFLNGLPDAAFMTSRLNLPNWFPFFIGSPESWGGTPHSPKLHGVVFMPVLLHPRSRGTVKLQTNAAAESPSSEVMGRDSLSYINPMRSPVIDPRYLSSDRDVAALVKGLMMVENITTSGPFAMLIEKELLPHCRPEVWRQLLTKNAFTGDAYVGLDEVNRDTSTIACNGNCSEQSSDGCSGAECLLSTLAANVAKQYPELEKIDPVLPRFCALASAHESGLISAEEWARGFVRLFTLTLYHPVGTCKMGVPDHGFVKAHSRLLYSHGLSEHAFKQKASKRTRLLEFQPRLGAAARSFHGDRGIEQGVAALPPWSTTSVVDGALRLCGGLCVQNVWVADVSVLPHLPSGNTHVPAVLVAHIAAEAIAEEWQKPI